MICVISGKAYWAHVVVPNTTFDSDGVWSIDVYAIWMIKV